MLGKRKLVQSELNADSSNNENKKPKIMGESELPDVGLQCINDDIAYIIIDFLKLSFNDLVALSLTCSRWHNQIMIFHYDKDIQSIFPNTTKTIGDPNMKKVLRQYYSKPDAISDFQIFQFQEAPTTLTKDIHIYAVPWAPHIVIVKTYNFAIFDLKKNEVVVPFMPDPKDTGHGYYKLCHMNSTRKQVVIAALHDNDDAADQYPAHYEWLYVYNIDETGTVEFITKFCVKNEYAMVYNEYDFYAPPNVYLADDGIIWHSVSDELKRFSIEKNGEIETTFDLHELGVMGIGEYKNRVLLFCKNYHVTSDISVFDTSSGNFIGNLPGSDEFNERVAQEIEMKIKVQNNLALITSLDGDLEAVYELDPFKQIYHCGFLIKRETHLLDSVLSPDSTMIVQVRPDALTIHGLTDAGSIPQHSIDVTTRSKSICICWIGNRRLLSVKKDSLALLGMSTTKLTDKLFYKLPLKTEAILRTHISIVSNTIYIVDLDRSKNNNTRQLCIYRLKVKD